MASSSSKVPSASSKPSSSPPAAASKPAASSKGSSSSSSLTEKQKQDYTEAFGLWDTDKDGLVTGNDIGTMMRSLGMNPTDADIRETVKQHGADGKVNLSAFLKIMQDAQSNLLSEKEIIEAFKVFDVNNSGYISSSELRHVLTILGDQLSNEEVQELLKEADDGTGKVNYRKYAVVLLTHRN